MSKITRKDIDALVAQKRRQSPELKNASHDEVFEAILSDLAKARPDRVQIKGKGPDGKTIFRINPPIKGSSPN